MNALKGSVIVCGLSLFLSGCDALTGAQKLTNCGLTDLSVQEVLALNQVAIELLQTQDPATTYPPLTEAQAQALVNFVNANEMNCLEDIGRVAFRAEHDPESILGLRELAAAFADTQNEFDPNLVTGDQLLNILDLVLSGQLMI